MEEFGGLRLHALFVSEDYEGMTADTVQVVGQSRLISEG